MTLNERLLKMLSTPAARTASDDDTRRAVLALLDSRASAPVRCGCERGDGCCDELPDGGMVSRG